MYQGSQKHGHCFERSNAFVDNLKGQKSKVLKQTVQNGPDRENQDKSSQTIFLQDKLCKTAAATEAELFEKNRYRYVCPKTGKYYPTVVAKDQYEEVVRRVERRIGRGEVPGLKKGQARQIIKSSAFTYSQIHRATQVLTLESIALDVASCTISSLTGATVDLILFYHLALKDGHTKEKAREIAANKAMSSFSTKLLSHVLTHQLARTDLMRLLMRPSLYVVTKIMPKVIRNSVAISVGVTPSTIASVGSTAKLLQAGVVSTVVTTVVLSLVDLKKFFTHQMSGKALVRNVAVRAGSIAGAALGSTLGRALLGFLGFFNPWIGLIGGLIGAAAGAHIGGNTAKTIVDIISPDQEKYFKELLNEQLSKACQNFSVTLDELESYIMPVLKELNYEDLMWKMEKASNPERFACAFSTRLVAKSLADRRHLLPEAMVH
jgi:hypothetical protein